MQFFFDLFPGGITYWLSDLNFQQCFKAVSFTAIVSTSIAYSLACNADVLHCKEIQTALHHADTAFEPLCAADLPDARCESPYSESADCRLHEDIEKKSLRCVWRFKIGDPGSFTAFEAYRETIRQCIGHRSIEQHDAPVNHPDSYLSHIFSLPRKELVLSLKHKSQLALTLVAISISVQQ